MFLEAAHALGRSVGASGVDTRWLERECFRPARHDAARFVRATPVSPGDAATAAARGAPSPLAWLAQEALDLRRMRVLQAATGSLDGLQVADVGVGVRQVGVEHAPSPAHQSKHDHRVFDPSRLGAPRVDGVNPMDEFRQFIASHRPPQQQQQGDQAPAGPTSRPSRERSRSR